MRIGTLNRNKPEGDQVDEVHLAALKAVISLSQHRRQWHDKRQLSHDAPVVHTNVP